MVHIVLRFLLSNFWRYTVCSLLYNFGAFLFWIVVPLLATQQGATNLDLAIINAVNYGSCFLLSWLCGFINDQIAGWILVRIGVVIYIAACILLMFVNNNLWILWIMAIMYAISYVFFWVPIQCSISRESDPVDADFWLGVFSGSWTFGQAVGYLCGAFLFTKLGVVQSLSISIASLSLILFLYPCWEGTTVFGVDLNWKKKTSEQQKERIGVITMGKKERHRLKKRMMQYLVPAFLCSIGCYGTVLAYGSQYFNRVYGTKDAFFPSMKDSASKYDIFIGVFFFVVFLMFTIGFISVANFKFLFFNRWNMIVFLIISTAVHFIAGAVSNWIVQLVCGMMMGFCAAYASQNLLVTTSKLSLLTSRMSSVYVGLQESLTFNLVAFALPLIVGPISDALNDYRVPMFGCSVVCVLAICMLEVIWQMYDILVIQKMDKEDKMRVDVLFNKITTTQKCSILSRNGEEFEKYSRANWFTWKQYNLMTKKLKNKMKCVGSESNTATSSSSLQESTN
ncbi:hypothetical protein EIN_469380 [Entamoeba invadens IP1]|uniref:Major facilitator superfamily (MFS) profile domain-containing protein n=1 Tax=Entamoeba invadens IP1 TaxID=370355 RepID=A0A0A1TUL5_ENTIV|nr:hypothetical protein EIN_469380 [Entamoeba invadens IP1]ELP83734.1 hypothetical protein EIN_469380 [Entamoeba invadens IP1]|eukprot:XP_004183080.1 hypothetical protein EIN_469380 [Entamoeba invadens IP1]